MARVYIGFRLHRPGIHEGEAVSGGCHVRVMDGRGNKQPLNPHLELRNHSPTGFEWGYGGSGPAQLAFALAMDATGDRRRAEHVHQRLKFRLVGRLPYDGWLLTQEEVLAAIRAIEDQEPVGELGEIGADDEDDKPRDYDYWA